MHMLEKTHDGVRWLEFELFDNCPIVHGCFMRHGGVSQGIHDSLNLSRHVGDLPKNVESNIKKAKKALSLPTLSFARIEHKDKVSEIGQHRTPLSDGLMTAALNRAICVTHADCQAAIFYDPINHKLGLVHSGWRSSALNIYAKTVDAMKSAYGTNPSDLLVGISPSLGPESGEFINYKVELPEPFWQFQIKPLYFDFWAISEWQLKCAGVLPHHIQIAKTDTKTSPDFFSHRNPHRRGRNGTIAMLK